MIQIPILAQQLLFHYVEAIFAEFLKQMSTKCISKLEEFIIDCAVQLMLQDKVMKMQFRNF